MALAVSTKRLSRTVVDEIVECMKKASADQTINHEYNEAGKGTFTHGDGWGIVWLNSFGHLASYGSLSPFYEMDLEEIEPVLQHAADSPLFMIHVRKASPGIPKGCEYLHPFVRSTKQGMMAFVHNGTIVNYETLGLVDYADEVLTKSDSERLFYYLVGRMEWNLEEDIKELKDAIEHIPAGSSANFILVRENPLTVYASTNFSDKPKYLTMQYAATEDMLVIASEKMQKSPLVDWKPLENKKLLKVWKDDQKLYWQEY